MEKAIIVGSTFERNIIVNSNQTTSFLWEGENVFSTPSMIAEMEETCRLLLKEQFLKDLEWDSVGTLVNIKHVAATPIGTEVNLHSKITAVNDRRITFEVEARDRIESIGSGIHERVMIDIKKFRDKFTEKVKKLEQNL
jgi:fluoroacetyl-CoA thioesterase